MQTLKEEVFEHVISPEDVILLDELVNSQNFSIALDMLRQKVAPILKLFPDEIKDIARAPRCKRIHVRSPPTIYKPVVSYDQTNSKDDDVKEVDLEDDNMEDENEKLIREQDIEYEKALLEDMKRDHLKKQAMFANVPEPEPIRAPKTTHVSDKHQTPDDPNIKKVVDGKKEKIVLPEEPESDSENAVTVCVTIPFKDGLRLERRFNLQTDLIGAVLGWLSNELDVDEQTLRVCTNFPKTYYTFFTPLSQLQVQRKRLMLICEN